MERDLTNLELLYEIVRLAKVLGKELTEADMDAYGAVGSALYQERWGSFPNAKREAYQTFGTPLIAALSTAAIWN
jgi:hypothetical protein